MFIFIGYCIIKIHEVYDWPPVRRQTGLFKDYVNTFLKMKQEASGWPSWVTTEQDKLYYVEMYGLMEDIELNPENINKNPGMRSLAKLCLNAFW